MEQWKRKERIPIPEQTEIVINGTTIICDECIGRGSSCLVYRGHILSENSMISNTDIVIKEFYPESFQEAFDIYRDKETGKLAVSDWTKETKEYSYRYKQFQAGLKNQKRLSRSDAMEIAIKPWMEGSWGDTCYIVCDVHKGKDLKRAQIDTLDKKIKVALGIAEAMDILYDANYIMLDIKPENLMWIEHPSAIRLIDVDSVVQKDEIECADQTIWTNLCYASPEVQVLKHKLAEKCRQTDLQNAKENAVKKTSVLYSLGIYFYELFFGSIADARELEKMDTEELKTEFIERYCSENYEQKCLEKVAEEIVDILKKTIVVNPAKRKKSGFADFKALMKKLQEVYMILSSEGYAWRQEVAKANGTFASYHLLLEKPLFRYRNKKEDHTYELDVVLVGRHVIRQDMISAILCIGQMLDTEMHLHVLGEDAEVFWKKYTSERYNPALKDALIVYKNGLPVSETFRSFLVERPLAHIHLWTEKIQEELLKFCKREQKTYYLILEEEADIRADLMKHMMQELGTCVKDRCMIGYLYEGKDLVFDSLSQIKDKYNIDFAPISVDRFSDIYNEKMFSERIFKMGLTTCAYYYGAGVPGNQIDMEALEKEFRKDPYGIASSERSALHGIYKCVCVGVECGRPGWSKSFDKKLEDRKILDELAWLEHLSWTAYLLTTGGIPVFTKAEELEWDTFVHIFESYAYQGNNDWKDKSNAKHLRHPFLVASSNTDGSADPLDRIGVLLFEWYKVKSKEIQKEVEQWKKYYSEEFKNDLDMRAGMKHLAECSLNCIQQVGKSMVQQDKTTVYQWKDCMNKYRSQIGDNEEGQMMLNELMQLMRPVLDSFNERDLKVYDYEVVKATADMLGI